MRKYLYRAAAATVMGLSLSTTLVPTGASNTQTIPKRPAEARLGPADGR